MKSNNNWLGIMIGLIGLGLVLGLFIKGAATVIADRDRSVSVRGLSEREVEANKVTWPLVYTMVGNDIFDIYSRIEKNNAVIANYLTSNGLTDKEFSVNAPDITDNQANSYGGSQAPYRYTVKSVTTVTSHQVDKVRELIRNQGQLLKSGITVTVGDWQYSTIYEYTDLNTIKPEMIADATAKAREAADKFTADSGCQLGRLLNATQGQFSIEDRDPYTPYIKKVRVVTSLTYAIE